jgi:Domain of unknown function (DUF4432)
MYKEQIASLDQVARVSASRLDGGPADGMRVIDVALLGGLSFRVLPDRGLDIGSAWCASGDGRIMPISWTSKLGESQPPLDVATGSAWITRFSGGLLTTCGIDNVGPTSEGIGLHGSFSHRRASEVSTQRLVDADGVVSVSITGVIEDADALFRHIRIHRTITATSRAASVMVKDVVENLGAVDEPIPVLYHCNFGFPFWSDGATVSFPDGTTAIPRDGDASEDANTADFPGTGQRRRERVYERCVPAGSAVARIQSPACRLTVAVRWSAETLDRCVQWIHPGAGVSALGIEPSNASVLGRAHDRSEGRLPTLAPGESKTFWVEICASPLDV